MPIAGVRLLRTAHEGRTCRVAGDGEDRDERQLRSALILLVEALVEDADTSRCPNILQCAFITISTVGLLCVLLLGFRVQRRPLQSGIRDKKKGHTPHDPFSTSDTYCTAVRYTVR